MRRYKYWRGWYVTKSVNILWKSGKIQIFTSIQQEERCAIQSPLYRHLIQFREHGMAACPLYSVWNIFTTKISIFFEFGIHFKVLALMFLKLIRDGSDTRRVWLRSCDHVSILSGIGEFYSRHNFILSECGVHTDSSCRVDTGVKAAR
jgi:hypothetical protein